MRRNATGKEIIETGKFKLPPGLPFSKGTKKGKHIYVSGMTPFDEKGEFIGEGDIYKQTIQVLKDLVAVVESGGGTIEDIVQTRVFLKSMSDLDTMNQAYKDFFGSTPYPARTTIEVSLALESFLIEIDAVVILD